MMMLPHLHLVASDHGLDVAAETNDLLHDQQPLASLDMVAACAKLPDALFARAERCQRSIASVCADMKNTAANLNASVARAALVAADLAVLYEEKFAGRMQINDRSNLVLVPLSANIRKSGTRK